MMVGSNGWIESGGNSAGCTQAHSLPEPYNFCVDIIVLLMMCAVASPGLKLSKRARVFDSIVSLAPALIQAMAGYKTIMAAFTVVFKGIRFSVVRLLSPLSLSTANSVNRLT
jgi:hypothetical protein